MVGKLVQSVQPDSAVTLSVPGVEEQAMRMRFDIPDWAGADREALIYKSVTDFTPIGLTMISGRLFNAPVRPDIVHEVVVWQLAKRRAGTAKQKGRSEVHYSTRKLRPQKGTGRARLGSRGAMHLVGGGRAHPKRPRNFDYPLPVPFRRNGLRSVLTTKYASGHLWIVENCDIPEVNSLILEDAFVKLGWESVMICDWNANGERNVTTNTDLAQLPMENVLMIKPEGLNVYDLLSFDHVVLTLPALHKLEERYTMHNELY
ncbi:50S ribosomal protein L4 [Porphyridium purpureum]|uniref:Large ribosomal subunit protein uL4m n=1 Tax=Porphyridium purpureum TaxID=35688 RepID=A0A5J4YWG9_PORPP|nr:50S ribosomal protein L4 [Porphyridium purpureum]|eukprot:POR2559..scf209_3